MATEQRKVKSLILPPGLARFPTLWVPQQYMEDGKPKGDPKYSTGVIHEDEGVRSKVEAIYKKTWLDWGLDEEDFKSPYRKDKKDKTIRFINASTGAKYKPMLVDSRNRRISVEFGGGSTIVLDVALVYSKNQGGLIVSYINSVQLLKRTDPSGASTPRFDVVEDGYEADEDETAPTGFKDHGDGEDMHDF